MISKAPIRPLAQIGFSPFSGGSTSIKGRMFVLDGINQVPQ
jgi:hypothetical protein